MKRHIWWITLLPCTILMLVVWHLQALVKLLIKLNAYVSATCEVIEVIMFRYEMWSVNCSKDFYINSPWRYTLKQVFERELKESRLTK